MEKINAVYSVSNKLSGGLRPPERKPSEIRNLHEEVKTYNMTKPVPYEEFSSWPEDIQKEYLNKLYWTYGGTFRSIADMLGCPATKVHNLFDDMSIPRMTKRDTMANIMAKKAKWNSFLQGKTLVKDTIPEEAKEKLENLVKELPVEVIKKEEVKEEAITKTPAQALAEVIALLSGTGAEITLKITL